MTPALLIADVGDVLIGTYPGAHHRALAGLTDLSVSEVEARIERGGLPCRFERGAMSPATFAQCLRRRLAAPHLSDTVLQDAWNAVIGNPVPSIVGLTALLAEVGRLVLASNTNRWHWPVVRNRLAAAGLPARGVPVVLSFEVGHTKPDADFFRAVLRHIAEPGAAVFVDDRCDNVREAGVHGLDGWIHTDIDVTVTRIRKLVADSR